MNRELAKKKAQSRDCHCINGENRDSNFNSVIDEVFDYFENNVVLDDVNQQRELLVDFWMNLPHANKNKNIAKHYVDKYLESTN